jgi:adenosylcobyric acid synthase
VVLLGEAVDTITAGTFRALRPRLADTAYAALAELRGAYDVVICEGAGSPAEINLRAGDYVNMGLARHAQLPTIVVGDIDRGGVFASMFGTVALLDPADQALVAGFVINKFRGDLGLLQPGLDMLRQVTGRPTYGVLPWSLDLWLDAEDSLAYGRVLGRPAAPRGTDWLDVAVVRLPRISNATDVEALATEPGVRVRLTVEPAELAAADLVVLPGSKSTVADLAWLRETGLADAVVAHAAAGKPLLGICGGFQMLARAIHDPVESRRGSVPGMGLLPIEITFDPRKTVRQSVGTVDGDVPVRGYEIHHGYVSSAEEDLTPLLTCVDGRGGGGRLGTRHALARRLRVRRVPPSLPHRGSPAGRPHRVPGRTGHVLRRRPRAVPGPARRPRRGAPGHRRAVAPRRGRPARRAAVHPTRRPGTGGLDPHGRTSAGRSDIGSPAACHASTPPMMSVARCRPRARRLATARLEL